MNKRNYSGKNLPEIQPGTKTSPEVLPPAEPGGPAAPAEDQPEMPVEVPPAISPYDFPPPGEGLFPEIFST